MVNDLDIELRNRTMVLTEQQERAEFGKAKLTYWPVEIRAAKRYRAQHSRPYQGNVQCLLRAALARQVQC